MRWIVLEVEMDIFVLHRDLDLESEGLVPFVAFELILEAIDAVRYRRDAGAHAAFGVVE